MAARSHQRGHEIEYSPEKGWLYSDDRTPISIKRPCIRCGRMPTPEGYDACLGYIPEAISACCGHGVEEGFIK